MRIFFAAFFLAALAGRLGYLVKRPAENAEAGKNTLSAQTVALPAGLRVY
jgi:hypothetical protein